MEISNGIIENNQDVHVPTKLDLYPPCVVSIRWWHYGDIPLSMLRVKEIEIWILMKMYLIVHKGRQKKPPMHCKLTWRPKGCLDYESRMAVYKILLCPISIIVW